MGLFDNTFLSEDEPRTNKQNWYWVGWKEQKTEVNGRMKTTYVYTGAYYWYGLAEKELRVLKAKHAALAAALTVLYIIAAASGAACYERFYVGLPYLLAMIPWMLYIAGIACLTVSGREMTYRSFHASYGRYSYYIKFLVGLFAVALVGDAVFLVLYRNVVFWGREILWLICMLLCEACCVLDLLLSQKYEAYRLSTRRAGDPEEAPESGTEEDPN